ncbi:hypothetical protein GCM10025868_26650 [Angustibacter aerolatus]|uniref:NERD domain-containing protein n=1 Tax=Angustibacter aerolatus TaxID=1162965 RepID=A0ABQ6JKV1_9ACTN|nr:hypothetical protein GCM10025868_26650 [Angustibacter aerolatus]
MVVIDAKRYQGRPRLEVDGGLFRPRTERLRVGGRDCTRLVAGVQQQVGLVRAVLAAHGAVDVPVRGVLCFVEADWPLIGGAFTVDDVDVVWPKRLASSLRHEGPLDDVRRHEPHRVLAGAFPCA